MSFPVHATLQALGQRLDILEATITEVLEQSNTHPRSQDAFDATGSSWLGTRQFVGRNSSTENNCDYIRHSRLRCHSPPTRAHVPKTKGGHLENDPAWIWNGQPECRTRLNGRKPSSRFRSNKRSSAAENCSRIRRPLSFQQHLQSSRGADTASALPGLSWSIILLRSSISQLRHSSCPGQTTPETNYSISHPVPVRISAAIQSIAATTSKLCVVAECRESLKYHQTRSECSETASSVPSLFGTCISSVATNTAVSLLSLKTSGSASVSSLVSSLVAFTQETHCVSSALECDLQPQLLRASAVKTHTGEVSGHDAVLRLVAVIVAFSIARISQKVGLWGTQNRNQTERLAGLTDIDDSKDNGHSHASSNLYQTVIGHLFWSLSNLNVGLGEAIARHLSLLTASGCWFQDRSRHGSVAPASYDSTNMEDGYSDVLAITVGAISQLPPLAELEGIGCSWTKPTGSMHNYSVAIQALAFLFENINTRSSVPGITPYSPIWPLLLSAASGHSSFKSGRNLITPALSVLGGFLDVYQAQTDFSPLLSRILCITTAHTIDDSWLSIEPEGDSRISAYRRWMCHRAARESGGNDSAMSPVFAACEAVLSAACISNERAARFHGIGAPTAVFAHILGILLCLVTVGLQRDYKSSDSLQLLKNDAPEPDITITPHTLRTVSTLVRTGLLDSLADTIFANQQANDLILETRIWNVLAQLVESASLDVKNADSQLSSVRVGSLEWDNCLVLVSDVLSPLAQDILSLPSDFRSGGSTERQLFGMMVASCLRRRATQCERRASEIGRLDEAMGSHCRIATPLGTVYSQQHHDWGSVSIKPRKPNKRIADLEPWWRPKRVSRKVSDEGYASASSQSSSSTSSKLSTASRHLIVDRKRKWSPRDGTDQALCLEDATDDPDHFVRRRCNPSRLPIRTSREGDDDIVGGGERKTSDSTELEVGVVTACIVSEVAHADDSTLCDDIACRRERAVKSDRLTSCETARTGEKIYCCGGEDWRGDGEAIGPVGVFGNMADDDEDKDGVEDEDDARVASSSGSAGSRCREGALGEEGRSDMGPRSGSFLPKNRPPSVARMLWLSPDRQEPVMPSSCLFPPPVRPVRQDPSPDALSGFCNATFPVAAAADAARNRARRSPARPSHGPTGCVNGLRPRLTRPSLSPSRAQDCRHSACDPARGCHGRGRSRADCLRRYRLAPTAAVASKLAPRSEAAGMVATPFTAARRSLSLMEVMGLGLGNPEFDSGSGSGSDSDSDP